MTFEPRNIRAARRHLEDFDLALCPAIVVSLVGETSLRWPHVYIDPGRSYDYAGVQYAQCIIATKPGIDTGRAIAEVFDRMERDFFCSGLPLLVDVERKQVATLASIKPLQARDHPPGTRAWDACFG